MYFHAFDCVGSSHVCGKLCIVFSNFCRFLTFLMFHVFHSCAQRALYFVCPRCSACSTSMFLAQQVSTFQSFIFIFCALAVFWWFSVFRVLCDVLCPNFQGDPGMLCVPDVLYVLGVPRIPGMIVIPYISFQRQCYIPWFWVCSMHFLYLMHCV